MLSAESTKLLKAAHSHPKPLQVPPGVDATCTLGSEQLPQRADDNAERIWIKSIMQVEKAPQNLQSRDSGLKAEK